MPQTVLQILVDEIAARIATVPDTEHLGHYAGEMPQRQCTAIGKPVQDQMEDAEGGAERFQVDIPIGLKCVETSGDKSHSEKMVALYGAIKFAIFGGDPLNPTSSEIDMHLGGKAELVFETAFTADNQFDMAALEADGTLTITAQYSTLFGNPYVAAN